MSNLVPVFTETHHALLFAWIARALISTSGDEKAAPALRAAVTQYGMERGRRMALRARANGDPLSMASYMAYGEWQSTPGAMEQVTLENTPHAHVHIPKCPWYTAWDENGLMESGRYYCQVIDEALGRGFNPALHIAVNGTRSNGAAQCDFVYEGANLTPEAQAKLDETKAANLGRGGVLPWEYHTGHLYKTMRSVLEKELGETGRDAAERGLAEFSAYFGAQAAQVVESYIDTDFKALPAHRQG